MKRQYLKNKKGVTLIELIVVIGILGMVITSAFSTNMFGMNIFSKSEDRMNNQFEVRMVTDYIAKQIRFADSINIISGVPTPSVNDGNHYFYISSGRIYYYEDGIEKIIPGTQGVTDYTLSFDKNGNDKVISYEVGKIDPTYNIKTDVKILNLKQPMVGTNGIGVIFTTKSADDVVIPLSIVSVADKNDNAVQFTVYPMPLNVVATMSDGSNENVPVSWNSTIDTSTLGVKAVTGDVIGFITKVNLTVNIQAMNIVSIDDITKNTLEGDPFSMPASVSALMSDDSFHLVPITWNPSVDTSIAIGETSPVIKIAEGTVVGYTPKVILTLIVEESGLTDLEVLDARIATITSNSLGYDVSTSTILIPDELSDGVKFKFSNATIINNAKIVINLDGKSARITERPNGGTRTIELTLQALKGIEIKNLKFNIQISSTGKPIITKVYL